MLTVELPADTKACDEAFLTPKALVSHCISFFILMLYKNKTALPVLQITNGAWLIQ